MTIFPNNYSCVEEDDFSTVIKGVCSACEKEWTVVIETIKFQQLLSGEEVALPESVAFTLETNVCIGCSSNEERTKDSISYGSRSTPRIDAPIGTDETECV